MVEDLNSTLAVDLNNWQNIGKARVFARKYVPKKYMSVYMTIVDFSIGFGKSKTHHKTVTWFSKEVGIDRKTFIKHIAELQKLGFIKVVKPSVYVEGGGTIPNAYSICYTVGKHSMGHMTVDKKDDKEESSKPDTTGRVVEILQKLEAREDLTDDEEVEIQEMVSDGKVIDTLKGLGKDDWDRRYKEIKQKTGPIQYKLNEEGK